MKIHVIFQFGLLEAEPGVNNNVVVAISDTNSYVLITLISKIRFVYKLKKKENTVLI